MRLLIVRHGETEWNTQKLTQGTSDTQLTDRGRRQAKKLSFRLRNMRIHAIYTSPLTRALESAEIIARFRRWPVIKEERLLEIAFGQWEGRTFDSIREAFPEALEVWSTRPQDCVIPGGELVSDVERRVDSFLDYIKAEFDKKTVMAVTHSVPAKLLVARSIGLPVENIHSLRMDNASLTIIDFYPDRPIMRLFNDCTHLQEGVIWPR